MAKQTQQILLHITGCILFLSLPVFFSPDQFRSSYLFSIPPFQRDFLSYVLLLFFFYLSYFYIIPQFYFKKKYVLLAVILFLCFLTLSFLPDLLISPAGVRPFAYQPAAREMPFPPSHHGPLPGFMLFSMGNKLFKFMVAIAFSFLLRIHFKWKKAEQEKANTELSYLKAQINPHFLFNTLNSIYSLAITRSDNTADAIVKLSGLMRYVITEASHDFVSLEKEINYITDYIELQKIRLDNTVKVQYLHSGNMDEKRIAPLILIAFIENAFKHGVNPEEESAINIHVNVITDKLTLTVRNNKVRHLQEGEVMNGMGIENARSRLNHLYPGKHELVIRNEPAYFYVELTIELL